MANLVLGCCLLLLVSGSVFASPESVHHGGLKLYELKRGNFTVRFTNWGATVVSVIVPDKNGV